MCTAVVSIEPGKPVLLVGVRDELTDRPWEPPGAHWPAHPELIGGRDLQAGGTWLAVMPSRRRVSCVLNGVGVMAPAANRRSRGELPLLGAAGRLAMPTVAAEPEMMAVHGRSQMQARPASGYRVPAGSGALPVRARVDAPATQRPLAGYDPFRLVVAEPDQAVLWSWDGTELAEHALLPGLHVIVNSGLASDLHGASQMATSPDPAGRPATSWDEPGWWGAPPPDGREHELARTAHFLARFRSASRPDPRPGEPVSQAWGAWFQLVNGDGIGRDDPRALIVRRDLGEGHAWGTTSISLVALASGWLRYDFTSRPGEPSSWYEAL